MHDDLIWSFLLLWILFTAFALGFSAWTFRSCLFQLACWLILFFALLLNKKYPPFARYISVYRWLTIKCCSSIVASSFHSSHLFRVRHCPSIPNCSTSHRIVDGSIDLIRSERVWNREQGGSNSITNHRLALLFRSTSLLVLKSGALPQKKRISLFIHFT